MTILTINRPIGQVSVCVALSWLGEYIHNVADLPQSTLLSPENSVVALIALVLVLAYWGLPFKHVTTTALLAWGLIHLIGGIMSVIPFSFLPFYPEQSLRHYFFHVIYALAQLPLIGVMISRLRQLRSP